MSICANIYHLNGHCQNQTCSNTFTDLLEISTPNKKCTCDNISYTFQIIQIISTFVVDQSANIRAYMLLRRGRIWNLAKFQISSFRRSMYAIKTPQFGSSQVFVSNLWFLDQICDVWKKSVAFGENLWCLEKFCGGERGEGDKRFGSNSKKLRAII